MFSQRVLNVSDCHCRSVHHHCSLALCVKLLIAAVLLIRCSSETYIFVRLRIFECWHFIKHKSFDKYHTVAPMGIKTLTGSATQISCVIKGDAALITLNLSPHFLQCCFSRLVRLELV